MLRFIPTGCTAAVISAPRHCHVPPMTDIGDLSDFPTERTNNLVLGVTAYLGQTAIQAKSLFAARGLSAGLAKPGTVDDQLHFGFH